MTSNSRTTTNLSNSQENIKRFENDFSSAVFDLQKLLDIIGNAQDGISSKELQQIINKQPRELQVPLKQVMSGIQGNRKILTNAQNIADDVIREEQGLSPTNEVEGALTGYLSCLQEALEVVQKSNASTIEGLEQEISRNKKISKGARSILDQEVKHIKQLNIPGAKPTVGHLQAHLKEGVKDIKSLRSNVQGLQRTPSANNKIEGPDNQKSVKAIFNNAVANIKNVFLGRNELTEVGLSQMRQLALSVEKALQVLGVDRSNVRQNAAEGIAQAAKKGETQTERIATKDNTNIEYSEKGLGEHTEVKVRQEETTEGLKVDNTQDAEVARNRAKTDYMNKTAYDMDKDGDLKVSRNDSKEAASSIADLPIIGGFSEQNPSSELHPSDVNNPNAQESRNKGGSKERG